MSERRVVFTPSGRDGTVPAGSTVLDAARALGVDLDSVCGGRGSCGRCQVVPVLGALAKWGLAPDGSELSTPGPTEQNYRGRRAIEPGGRLGCQAVVHGDVVIDVPADSQLRGPVVRKSIDVAGLTLDPATVLRVVDTPAMDGSTDAASALSEAIAAEWAIDIAAWDVAALREVHRAVGGEEGVLTVAVQDRSGRPVAVRAWPGIRTRPLGAAVDIGSTTLAVHVLDLATGEVLGSHGAMNPQIRLGEDLMSRVSYVMMNDGGCEELTTLVRQALVSLFNDVAEAAGVEACDILEVVLVGNPIMHHLVLGLDPTPLGQAPFVLATASAMEIDGRDLGLQCQAARVYIAPCIAGHVGADTAAAILATSPHTAQGVQLLVDIGTNAEIVLSGPSGLFAASSPTGPAFEGAQITHGQRATAGAIERVRIDPTSLEPTIKVIGSDLWSDSPLFSQEVADADVTGICGSGIVDVMAQMYLAGVLSADGTIGPVPGRPSDRIVSQGRTYGYVLHRFEAPDRSPIIVTQADVRAVQLAKAALRAGIDLLLERAGIDMVDGIWLAGAFGAHLDPFHTRVLGLVPDAGGDSVRAVGNAAGAGAVKLLLSRAQRGEIERLVDTVTKIETALEPRFQQLFVDAMAIPHASAPTPYLEAAVALPDRSAARNAGPERRRRGRRVPTGGVEQS